MKIGEFAAKHHVTVDTVRHYINEGLLTPLRDNTQYNFSEIDDDIMDTILLLKEMNFKLGEMKGHILFQTMYADSSFRYFHNFKSRFEEKHRQNLQEIKRLQKINKLIEEKIKGYEDKVKFTRGSPLGFLNEFACSDCGTGLELNDPELLHNEIMTGELVCPHCGRKYYIRYGVISDEPIEDIDDSFDGIADMSEKYVNVNDNQYMLNARVFFQNMATTAERNSKGAKNVMVSGLSAGFLVSAVIRSIPKDARLYICGSFDIIIKLFQEKYYPKETVVYCGKQENAPYKTQMDYLFWQDYDFDVLQDRELSIYPHLSDNAVMDVFKVNVPSANTGVHDEKKFLDAMDKLGWDKISFYNTPPHICTKESVDLCILNKQEDLEVQYGVYSFKKNKDRKA